MIPLGILAASGIQPAAAGSYDLLATEILTSSQASVTFSSLGDYAADYQHLQIRAVLNRNNNAIQNGTITLNGVAMTRYHALRGYNGAVASFTGTSALFNISGSGDVYTALVMDILDPFETTKNTTLRTFIGSNSTVEPFVGLWSQLWDSTTAVSSIALNGNGGSWVTGSRFSLYGIKAA